MRRDVHKHRRPGAAGTADDAIIITGEIDLSIASVLAVSAGVNGFLGISWLSWSVAIFLVAAVIVGVVLRMTPFGRSLYAIGLNQDAAFHAGIRVKRTKLLLFVLSGVVSAAVGLLYAFELSIGLLGGVSNAASFVQRARMLMRRGQIRDRRKLLASADAEVLDRE